MTGRAASIFLLLGSFSLGFLHGFPKHKPVPTTSIEVVPNAGEKGFDWYADSHIVIYQI